MRILGAITDRIRSIGSGRNWRWYGQSKAFLAANPECVFCHRPAVVVHHVWPVAYFPEFEMDEVHWASCCEKHHLYVAHGGNWSDYLRPQVFWEVAEWMRANIVRRES